MNAKDVLWQRLIDEEKVRLSSLPVEELISMDFFTRGTVQGEGVTIEYGIWHEVHSEDLPYESEEESNSLSAQIDRGFGVRRPQRVTHSFSLVASRNLFFGIHTKYLAGFSLDEKGKVVPIADDVFYAHD